MANSSLSDHLKVVTFISLRMAAQKGFEYNSIPNQQANLIQFQTNIPINDVTSWVFSSETRGK